MSALMINDLSRAHELSRKEMASVSGGSVFQNLGINNITTGSGFSFASPNTITAPVTQVDASTHLDLTSVTNSINNLGGLVVGKLGL
ncbi:MULTISPECIES: hypothetical protein [Burkholderia]|uniref:Bacteriocin n=1 Tax=Burkholderia lata (strain ATCC 17760 / DSM 23089 / LMG 22485 / NCIMB 9086 / R18194 / 383) TaxID=482957 RepID=A0A6P2GQR7_BURL3|nr:MULTISPECIES: hypothetical protein [Burkholderia]MBN3778056.1 hypothetical protein [Burkholderia sp. Ac-20345]VWB05823.1 hypothetical protein BLA15945_00072 [Burkholderia lata]VWB22669.1 hypothetical protein BLA15816_00921 [Burkholderia lata]VWC67869.1 hypothetical protein BLA18110_01746 [Burkholderia lata]VWC74452.1 hypothetical protein BLA50215_00805 [Burkholderia lata]